MIRSLWGRGRVLILAALVSGCGSTGATVSGTVTFEGAPVSNGSISFLPADGKGPAEGAPIRGGQYKLDILVPGLKLVKIEAVKNVQVNWSSLEGQKAYEEAKAKGTLGALLDTNDLISPDAVGNNQTVKVVSGKQTFNFELRKPAKDR
jgi:hypothetical protein